MHNDNKRSDNNFWDYSLALYTEPLVAELCLQLQDTYDINVNLLLFCAWLEAEKIPLTTERLTQARVAIESWDTNYVQPLRRLRRNLKIEFAHQPDTVDAVREHIKRAELLAEKHEQRCLEILATEWQLSEDRKEFENNISVYLAGQNVPQDFIEKIVHRLKR